MKQENEAPVLDGGFGGLLPRPGEGGAQAETAPPGEQAVEDTGESGRRSFLRRALPLAAVLAVGVFGWKLAFSGPESGNVKTSAVFPDGDRLKDAAAPSSEEYVHRLEEYSQKKGDAAIESGGSFVGPPTGGPAPIQGEPLRPVALPAPEKKPAPVQKRQEEFAAPAAAKEPQQDFARRRRELREKESVKGDPRMVSYLSSLRFVPVQAESLEVGTPSRKASNQASSASPSASRTIPGVRPGDILLGVNRVTLDSDAPGPAMVEIVSGRWKGAKAMGSFSRLGEHLVLRFGELVDASGVSWKLQGYAIDPKTDRTAVRSDVDSHWLSRWGGVVAASFLEGFGNAVSRSGMSSVSSVYGSSQSYPRYDLESELWIGAAKVGERAANLFESGFSRAPTVVLRSGTLMGVLVVSVSASKSGEAASAQKEIEKSQDEARQNDESSRSPRSDRGGRGGMPPAPGFYNGRNGL